MNLLTKFSLIFVLVYGLGLSAAGIICHRVMQQNVREQVLLQARMMMDTAQAARTYTTDQIKPLLKYHEAESTFRPQSVPSYAATEMFAQLRRTYPEFDYREAALNPTQPRDRAVDWEEGILATFRTRPASEDAPIDGERNTAGGQSVYLARPIRAKAACLECHSTPDRAPVSMVKLYGKENGFNWKEGEVVAAQVVTVPASVPATMASRALSQMLISLGVVGLVTLLAMNTLFYFTVLRPIGKVARLADEISRGNVDVPEVKVRGKGEIAMLASAFNRMCRSVSAAMKMLEQN